MHEVSQHRTPSALLTDGAAPAATNLAVDGDDDDGDADDDGHDDDDDGDHGGDDGWGYF